MANKKSKSNKMKKQLTDAFKNEVKKATKSMLTQGGSIVGGAIASSIGISPKLGAMAGSKVGQRISRLIGSGDYQISPLPTVNSLIRGKVPPNASFGDIDRSVRIKHREFIGDVFNHPSTVGAFNGTQFVVNADVMATFPYLANVATLFEQYKFHGLVFEYISTVSPYGGGTASLGSVIMASQFNASNPAFVSKTQMENAENAISARTDQNIIYGVECANQVQNWYYTRHIGASPAVNTNVSNTYDLCTFTLGTSGGSLSANTNIGELWVTYDVELTGPRMPDIRQGYYHAANTSATTASPMGTAANVGVSRYGVFSGATLTTGSNTIVVYFNNASAGDIVNIWYTMSGTSAGTSPSIGLTANTNSYAATLSSAETATSFLSATTTTIAYNVSVILTGPNATATFTATGTYPTGTVYSDLYMVTTGFSVAPSSL